MSLLSFLGAGAAQGYAHAKNLETEQQNKVGFALIQAEMENQFKERLAERQFQMEKEMVDIRSKASMESDKAKFDHDEKMHKAKSENQMKLADKKLNAQMSIESMRQGRADARLDKKIASSQSLLNTQSSGSSGGLSMKELTKANESDKKEIHNIKLQLSDPMLKSDMHSEKSAVLKARLDELERNVLRRKQLINSDGKGSGESLSSLKEFLAQ